MVKNNGKTLTTSDLAELNEIEVKKYNTRLMLEGLLEANKVKRLTISPGEMMIKQSTINPKILQGQTVSPVRKVVI